MAAARSGLSLAAIILLAGGLVMLWFVILGGVTHTTPLDRTNFLRADTSGITGARPISQWNYFHICGDGNNDCSKAAADAAVGSAWSPYPSNAPADLVGSHGGHTTSSRFFYMWRFGWVFYLLTLFFMTLTFFSSFLACCGRLGAAVSALLAVISLVFYTVGVSLMTATFVDMRNSFTRDGRAASLGRYAFGFSWASWFCLLVSSILLCIGIRRKDSAPTSTNGSRFGRRRSTRSHMSSDVAGRRVKDEYA